MNSERLPPARKPRRGAKGRVKGDGALAQGKAATALGRGARQAGRDIYEITTVFPLAAAPDDAAEATDGAGAAVVDLGPPAAEAVPQELVDDGRRTTVMAAVDIDAIVAASADAAPAEGGDDEPAPTAGGDKKKPARGKRKRGR